MRSLFWMVLTVMSSSPFGAQDKAWSTVETRDHLISFKMPPGFIVQNDRDPRWIRAYETLKQRTPEIQRMIGQGSGSPSQTLAAYDLTDSIADGAIDSFVVITKPNPGLREGHLERIAPDILKSLKLKNGGASKVIELPFGKALSYWGTIEIVVSDTAIKRFDTLAYLFLRGDHLHIVNFATGSGQVDRKRSLFEKIVRSAEFGDL